MRKRELIVSLCVCLFHRLVPGPGESERDKTKQIQSKGRIFTSIKQQDSIMSCDNIPIKKSSINE